LERKISNILPYTLTRASTVMDGRVGSIHGLGWIASGWVTNLSHLVDLIVGSRLQFFSKSLLNAVERLHIFMLSTL